MVKAIPTTAEPIPIPMDKLKVTDPNGAFQKQNKSNIEGPKTLRPKIEFIYVVVVVFVVVVIVVVVVFVVVVVIFVVVAVDNVVVIWLLLL